LENQPACLAGAVYPREPWRLREAGRRALRAESADRCGRVARSQNALRASRPAREGR